MYHTKVLGLRNVSHSELEGVQEKLFLAKAMDRGGLVTDGAGATATAQKEKDMVGDHDYYNRLEAGFNV